MISLELLVACFMFFAAARQYVGGQNVPLITAKSFSYVEQLFDENRRIVETTRVTYANALNLVRYDKIPMSGSNEGRPTRIVHDYQTGVEYYINKQSNVCVYGPIGFSSGINPAGGSIKDPNELLYIDNRLSFAGSNKKRDIDVDLFSSNRNDFKSLYIQTQPSHWVVTHAFMKYGLIDESSDASVKQPLVALDIKSSPEMNEKYSINIFDFDPIKLTASNFDVSNCFKGKEKIQFAIQFSYSQNYSQSELEQIIQIEGTIVEYFYAAIFAHLEALTVSPLRLTPAQTIFHIRGFEVFSGVTDSAASQVDTATKEAIYREIEKAVVRKELRIEIPASGGQQQAYVFPASSIYPATFDAVPSGGDSIGATSFFDNFRLFDRDIDFIPDRIQQSTEGYEMRSRSGVTIDECARLCRIEGRFKCESLSYETVLRECKWTNIFVEFFSTRPNPYTQKSEGYVVYVNNALQDYVHYPFAMNEGGDRKEITDQSTPHGCAFKCTTETEFKCKSFNYCEYGDGADKRVKCLLSDKHIQLNKDNGNLTFSPICSHYARQNIDDYKKVVKMQLDAKPMIKYKVFSAEECATFCSFSEGFICRSFDYFVMSRDCQLYDVSVKEANNLKSNVDSDHYSREYYFENGQDLSKSSSSGVKYDAGAIFGITIAFIILGLVIGVASIFAYVYFAKGVTINLGSSSSTTSSSAHISFKNPMSE